MKPGFVAMDGDGVWIWYQFKPYVSGSYPMWIPEWVPEMSSKTTELYGFDIAPFDGDWKDSLIEVGNEQQ